MSKKVGVVVAVLAAALLVGTVGLAMARGYGQSQSDENPSPNENCTLDPKLRILDRVNLTDEAEQEIIETVISMKEEGASHSEIRDTVRDMVEDYGAELPEEGEEHRHMNRGKKRMNGGQGQKGQGEGQRQRNRDC